MNSTQPLLSLEEVEIAYPKPDGKGWMRIVHDLNLQLEPGWHCLPVGAIGLRQVNGFKGYLWF